MRVPARFGLMTLLGIAVLAGLGVDIVMRRLTDRLGRHAQAMRGVFGALLLVGLGVEFRYAPIPLYPIETGSAVPPVYRWLAGQPKDDVVLEVPLRGGAGTFFEPRYVYFSTYHWRPLVNGYSGYVPTSYAEIAWQVRNLPDRYSIDYLGALGVGHLILHTAYMTQAMAGRWYPDPPAGLEKVAEFGTDIVYAIRAPEPAPDLHLTAVVAERLPTDSDVTIGLLAEAGDQRWWAKPELAGPTRVTIEWRERSGGGGTREDRTIGMPFVIGAGTVAAVGVPVRTPPRPGTYLVTLHSPSLGGSTRAVLVDLVEGPFLTSRDSSRLLAATYLLPAAPPTAATGPFEVRIDARNLGRATWLARSPEDRGIVRLGWRWLYDGGEIREGSGRKALKYDVQPGQVYHFSAKIDPPRAPGDYVLELGLVSEYVAWFSDLGIAPIRLPIRVPLVVPELGISVDRQRSRANEAVRMSYSLRLDEQRPRTVDAYLHLDGPAGVSWFHDGKRLVRGTREGAVPMARAVRLPARAEMSGTLLTLSLAGKPPGTYMWRLALTEPGRREVIVEATTMFRILP
jgi:hypothetical protein